MMRSGVGKATKAGEVQVRLARSLFLLAIAGVLPACMSTTDESPHHSDEAAIACGNLAKHCDSASCLLQWPSDPRSTCDLDPGVDQYDVGCGDYRALSIRGADYQSTLYFAANTLTLAAIVSYAANSGVTDCLGPTRFVVPHCDGSWIPIDCAPQDAAVEAE